MHFDLNNLGRRDFFFSFVPDSPLSMVTPLFLPELSSVTLSYFIPAVPIVRVFGKILVHEFPISYSHIEWDLLLSRNEMIEMVGIKN